jgi:putative hydrolase of the HAD superfamily
VRAVAFDLGGVVCRFLPERRLRALAQAARLPEQEVQARLWASGCAADCDRGRHDADDRANEIDARLGCRLARAEARRCPWPP